MKLMIIESPGKLKKLGAILGADWKIAASIGHIRDLPERDLGITVPDFEPSYELSERGAEVTKKIRVLAKEADAVFLSTDPDYEGEAISWHLNDVLRFKNAQRVSFGEITEMAVRSSLAKPRGIDLNRKDAQETRRFVDRFIGWLVSSWLRTTLGKNMSAGRVQSVATRIVVEREREIRAFKSTTHYGAELIFADAKTGEWSAEWKPKGLTEDNPYFLDRAFAQTVANTRSVVVTSFKDSEARRSPPPPFTTPALLQAGSVALGMNPAATMEAAQKLYEQGHITYHRTDNPNVSDESLGDIYAVAVKLGLDMADEPRRFKVPEGAQAGHPAITPTHWEVEEAGETAEQRALYKVIRLRAIACQLADARYAVRTVQLEGDGEAFEARGRTLVYAGWLGLVAGDQTDEDEDKPKEAANPIPALAMGDGVPVARGNLLEKKTKAPGRYTEAGLVKKLESEGIGRPSTYATIMNTILTRGYVVTEKKYLVPTKDGEEMVDALVGRFRFIDLDYTRELERDMDAVGTGHAKKGDVLARFYQQLQGELQAARAAVAVRFPCSKCGQPLMRRAAKTGKKGYFWGCSGYPDCDAPLLADVNGEPGKPLVELSDFACAKCGKPLIRRTKAGKGGYDFWGCSGFKDGCKTSYPTKDGKPDLANGREG